MLRELESRGHQARIRPDEGVTLILDDLGRHGLAVVLPQGRLEIEQIELARRAGHEQINDARRLRREVRRFRRHRPAGPRRSLRQQRRQRDLAHPDAAILEEMPAHDPVAIVRCVVHGGSPNRAGTEHRSYRYCTHARDESPLRQRQSSTDRQFGDHRELRAVEAARLAGRPLLVLPDAIGRATTEATLRIRRMGATDGAGPHQPRTPGNLGERRETDRAVSLAAPQFRRSGCSVPGLMWCDIVDWLFVGHGTRS